MTRDIIVLVLTLSIFATGANAQRKVISGADFTAAVSIGSKKSTIWPRRHNVTEEFFIDGKLTSTKSLIWEAVSLDRRRTVETENSGGQMSTLETIEIGDEMYQRKNNGDWIKQDWYFRHGLTENHTELLDSSEYWQETSAISNKKAKVFGASTKTIKNDVFGYKQERYWIAKNGRILKIETIYGQLDPRNITRRKVLEYEYDPTITIKAPIKWRRRTETR